MNVKKITGNKIINEQCEIVVLHITKIHSINLWDNVISTYTNEHTFKNEMKPTFLQVIKPKIFRLNTHNAVC